MPNRGAAAWALILLAAAQGARPLDGRVLKIDDFEDGDRQAASGLSWISIADDLTGGASFAEPRVSDAGAGSRHGLKVTGELASGGFAGAWVAFDGRARAVDASDFDGVRLKVRGAGAVAIAVRGGPMA